MTLSTACIFRDLTAFTAVLNHPRGTWRPGAFFIVCQNESFKTFHILSIYDTLYKNLFWRDPRADAVCSYFRGRQR